MNVHNSYGHDLLNRLTSKAIDMKSNLFARHIKSSYDPVDWYGLFTAGKRRGYTYYLRLLYPGLFLQSLKITQDHHAAVNITFNGIRSVWQQRDDLTGPEHLEDLSHDIVKDNSSIYRRMMIGIPDPARDAGGKEEKISTPDIPAQKLDIKKIKKDMLETIFHAMKKEPDKDMLILHEIIMKGRPVSKIAKTMNTSSNKVGIQKSRAIKSLWSRLDNPGLFYCWLLLLMAIS
jgi:DNA-directed RNA polymerase specialized sigma24 family protein